MNQSKLGSLIEAIFNTVIGFVISFITWPVAAWLFDLHYNAGQHCGVVGVFTLVSVARGYAIRRWFNDRLKRAANSLAKTVS